MIQEQEQRRVYYDKDLKIEAYNLSGVVQKFPNHFHEYYVIGFVEGGKDISGAVTKSMMSAPGI